MAMLESSALAASIFDDLDRAGPIPLYFQVSQRLELAIRSGALPAGQRLENEVLLGERLGLSRPTIRRAIQELVDKGLLVRRRGIGTQVVHGPVTRNVELTSLFDDLTESGQNPTTKILAHRVSPVDERGALELGLAVGTPVLHIKRLRLADETPLAVMENVLAPEFADLDPEVLASSGLYRMLNARGAVMKVAKQRIGARAATADESKLLELERGAAVLTMNRTAYNSAGTAVEFGSHVYRPDLYAFEVTLIAK